MKPSIWSMSITSLELKPIKLYIWPTRYAKECRMNLHIWEFPNKRNSCKDKSSWKRSRRCIWHKGSHTKGIIQKKIKGKTRETRKGIMSINRCKIHNTLFPSFFFIFSRFSSMLRMSPRCQVTPFQSQVWQCFWQDEQEQEMLNPFFFERQASDL